MGEPRFIDLRSDTVTRIRRWSRKRPRELGALLVPERKKLSTGSVQRIALDPERIELVDVEDS